MVLAADRPTATGGRRVDESARCSCWSVSTLGWSVSTVVVNLAMSVARSAMVGLAIGDEIDGVGDGGVVGGGASEEGAWWGWLEVEEDLLEDDTR